MPKKQHQGDILIAKLMRKPHTYGEMLAYKVSTSPWKRITERLRFFPELAAYRFVTESDGLTRWAVYRVAGLDKPAR